MCSICGATSYKLKRTADFRCFRSKVPDGLNGANRLFSLQAFEFTQISGEISRVRIRNGVYVDFALESHRYVRHQSHERHTRGIFWPSVSLAGPPRRRYGTSLVGRNPLMSAADLVGRSVADFPTPGADRLLSHSGHPTLALLTVWSRAARR